MDKYDVLSEYFGHRDFRPGQEELIDAVLSGRDVLGIMPTGGGKSLCYQVPALLLPGITLVISPLISLMKDQVMALKDAGVKAAFINSSLTAEQQRAALSNMAGGEYKIVYVAPERLELEGFSRLVKELEISFVAVDEAHCISQWGQDFRPSYLRIAEFLKKLPRRPVLAAFTATATEQVRNDVSQQLGLQDPLRIVTGFDRPNLYFDVLKPKNKLNMTLALLEQRRDKIGIIYCAKRSGVEKVCQALQKAGFSATRYHAGLSDKERRENQEDFLYDRAAVMVATNAFGMGIDKSNVGYVIHYNMPKSLEAYYQEAGRAGRDGEPADCLMLFSNGDVGTAKYFIENPSDNEQLSDEERELVRKRDYERLAVMVGYCKTRQCLRGYILDYFGQEHGEGCDNCGSCRGEFIPQDISLEAQKILSCVRRVRDRLGYNVGVTLIIHILCGSREKRVTQLGLDSLSTYGLMSDLKRPVIREYIEYLENEGYLRTDPVHGALELTPEADEVLFHGERVEISVKTPPAQERRRSRKKTEPAPEIDDDLYSALRALRYEISQQEGVPAYIVFSNACLADMAAKAPRSMSQLMEVSGVGHVKAQRYGQIFLDCIAQFPGE